MDLIRCTSTARAEQLEELNPDGVQRLLNQADWQSETVMTTLRAYVVEQLGSPEGVLIVDETGFLEKGQQWTSDSSGWARSGPASNDNTVARRVESRTLR
jgi:SRSO17 transposase